MNKNELIQTAANLSGQSQAEVKQSLNAILESISQSLKKEESVVLVGFGTFTVKERPARTGHNPSTGKQMQIPAKKVIKFKPSSALDIDSGK
jgi:integration host factor, beta subunit